MAIITRTIWPHGTLEDLDRLAPIFDRISQMYHMGKTDGHYKEQSSPDGQIVIRIWQNLEDAEEWNDFIKGQNPIQSTIEEM